MERPGASERDGDPARAIYPDMPNHAAGAAAFLALVDEGLADIEAGRTMPFETVAAKQRLKMYGPGVIGWTHCRMLWGE